MRVGRRNAVRGVSAGVLLAVLAFTIIVQYAPDSVAFSPNNYGWNGMQEVASAYRLNLTASLASIPSDGVLAIVQPSASFGPNDASSVKGFLGGGGTLLVADKSGVSNSLLRGIGSAITIDSRYSIIDQVFNWKAPSVPTALVLSIANDSLLTHVRGIALNHPSPLILGGPDALKVAITSQFSSVQSGARGPFVVVASERLGNGTLIVVGDSQFLMNSEWTIADNRIMIGNLFANRAVFIDTSHWSISPLTSSTAQVKARLNSLYGAISGIPTRYGFVLALVLVAFLLVPRSERAKARVPNIRSPQALLTSIISLPTDINRITKGS